MLQYVLGGGIFGDDVGFFNNGLHAVMIQIQKHGQAGQWKLL